ncbi:hypothetical protein NA57DRAFT_61407 [Rhizodiscina lignyota]|uniref:Kelch repeat-containing protein n=1 Tax=Rhizodiscina lignyota TaxID=1504668 RepID=A0A9P4I4K8_9PEZI|nr:hypothetical protein NA57DRAFT_61407 [Rhizodiscina lignyota]
MLLATTLLALLRFCLGSSEQGLDPINNMCSRWNHQSAPKPHSLLDLLAVIKDGILYIDGGIETFASNGQPPRVLGNNEYLIGVDMSDSWDWKVNVTEKAIPKTTPPSSLNSVPNMLRGAAFSAPANDPKIYIFGGSNFTLNSSFENYTGPLSDTNALWSFDPTVSEWQQHEFSGASPARPNRGAWADVSDQGLGFFLNGYYDSGTSTGYEYLHNGTIGQTGMAMVNTTDLSYSRNFSTSQIYGLEPTYGAAMAYVPGLGRKGSLIVVGGASKLITDSSEGEMNATGDTPRPRTDFCPVSAPAPDNSSYNIYLYGGQNPLTNEIYDEAFVLSIPSFIWIKLFVGQSPRYAHTCHFLGNRQMLTVGGSLSTNLTGTCDWEYRGVAILDMTDLTWGSVYNAYAAPYELPQNIYEVIGGSATGGANIMSPAKGFSDPSLAKLFTQPSNTSSPRTGTGGIQSTSTQPASTHTGAIAGGVVGGVVGLAHLAAACLILIRRFRGERSRSPEAGKSQDQTPHELPADKIKHTENELGTDGPVNELGVEGQLGELP